MRFSTYMSLSLGLTLACGGGENATAPSAVASKLAFTVEPPTTFVANSTFSFVVEIEDQAGNVVTNATNPVSLVARNSSGTVSLAGYTATTIPAVQGVAKFDSMEIIQAGIGLTVTASATGLMSATSTPFTVTAGRPYQFAFKVEPSTTALGSPFLRSARPLRTPGATSPMTPRISR